MRHFIYNCIVNTAYSIFMCIYFMYYVQLCCIYKSHCFEQINQYLSELPTSLFFNWTSQLRSAVSVYVFVVIWYFCTKRASKT